MSFEQYDFDSVIETALDKEIYANVFKILQEKYDAKIDEVKFIELATYKCIYFFKKAGVRILEKSKTIYISIPQRYTTDIDNERITKIKSEFPWVRLLINNGDDIFLYENAICNMFEDLMPDAFDCCSRYMQCSDELKCVQPIPKLMRECRYRKKLLNGMVFYGKNRNV